MLSLQLQDFYNEVAAANKVDLWIAYITCSPQQLSPYLEAMQKVKYVAMVYVLIMHKKTSNYERLPTSGGVSATNDWEHVIQVFFDARSRMAGPADVKEPQLTTEHFPFGTLDYLKDHPRFSPNVIRYQVFEAAYVSGSDKVKCNKAGYNGTLNLSEDSIDKAVKLVSKNHSQSYKI